MDEKELGEAFGEERKREAELSRKLQDVSEMRLGALKLFDEIDKPCVSSNQTFCQDLSGHKSVGHEIDQLHFSSQKFFDELIRSTVGMFVPLKDALKSAVVSEKGLVDLHGRLCEKLEDDVPRELLKTLNEKSSSCEVFLKDRSEILAEVDEHTKKMERYLTCILFSMHGCLEKSGDLFYMEKFKKNWQKFHSEAEGQRKDYFSALDAIECEVKNKHAAVLRDLDEKVGDATYGACRKYKDLKFGENGIENYKRIDLPKDMFHFYKKKCACYLVLFLSTFSAFYVGLKTLLQDVRHPEDQRFFICGCFAEIVLVFLLELDYCYRELSRKALISKFRSFFSKVDKAVKYILINANGVDLSFYLGKNFHEICFQLDRIGTYNINDERSVYITELGDDVERPDSFAKRCAKFFKKAIFSCWCAGKEKEE